MQRCITPASIYHVHERCDTWYPEVLGTPRTRFKCTWVCRSDLRPAVVQTGDGDNNNEDDDVAVVIAVVIIAIIVAVVVVVVLSCRPVDKS